MDNQNNQLSLRGDWREVGTQNEFTVSQMVPLLRGEGAVMLVVTHESKQRTLEISELTSGRYERFNHQTFEWERPQGTSPSPVQSEDAALACTDSPLRWREDGQGRYDLCRSIEDALTNPRASVSRFNNEPGMRERWSWIAREDGYKSIPLHKQKCRIGIEDSLEEAKTAACLAMGEIDCQVAMDTVLAKFAPPLGQGPDHVS